MCFNADISLTTYIIGLIGCIILIKKNFYVEAAFYFCVIQMQMIEYFLWKNQSCNDTNKITTKIGLIINHLEPIILWIAIYLFSKKILPEWVHYLIILYIFLTIIYCYYVYGDNCTTVTEASKPHLEWKWNLGPYAHYYYMFFLFILNILCLYGVEYGYHMAFLVNISFLISKLVYDKYHTVGAIWCFAAAFAPIISIPFYQLSF